MKSIYLFLFLFCSSVLLAQTADSLNNAVRQSEVVDTTNVSAHHTFNAQVMKSSIDSLCLQNRSKEPVSDLNKTLFLYHSAYHFVALPDNDIYLQDHGFTVRQTPFGLGYEIQKRAAFTPTTIDGRTISFDEISYNYPAALTSSEFGIGGQDMNIANLNIRKKNLLTVENLYGRFGTLLQRGIWADEYDNSTLEDIFLKYDLKNGNIQFHANSMDWDIPKIQHLLLDQETPFVSIREKSTLASLYWQNKWLNAGVQIYHVNWGKPALTFSGNQDFWQTLLEKELQFNDLQIQLRYEHFSSDDIKTAYSQYITPTDLRDLGTIQMKYQSGKFDLHSKVFISNPSRIGYDNTWDVQISRSIDFVACSSGMNTINDATDKNATVYTGIYNKSTGGIRFKQAPDAMIQLNLGMKTKYICYDDTETSQHITLHDNTPCFDAIVQVPFTYHQFTTKISSKLEAPFFQAITDIRLTYGLPYNNLILGGITHTYRDKSFLNMNIDESPVFNDKYENKDNLLDAYIGLQITKQFDIRFTVKNIMNQDIIFNSYLIPNTYLLSMKWDFIN
ncbi:MAG TPA: hypothetical protein PLE74_03050 [Candidatus Cloacimonadota bacterium]|nr:hypothetical protein [Candidatus Cloacimonadota bacterium]HPT71239.1 hypothetical protein [Candidatus Cloacimonadota bacterium]